MIHITKSVKMGHDTFPINLEVVDNGWEVVDLSSTRRLTDERFRSEADFTKDLKESFYGVRNISDAYQLMRSGCPEITKELKDYESKINLSGESKRVRFQNDIVGFAPVVPLAMQGVPNCMSNCEYKSMKNKVINVYYEMGASARYEPSDFRKGGCKLLGALMKLEMSGYRFNLYGFASFYRHGE